LIDWENNPDPVEARRAAAGHADAARCWLEAKLRHAADPTPPAEADEANARARLEQFVAAHPHAPFERLAASMGLAPLEHDLLLLCWVVERWPEEFSELIPPLQPSRSNPSVTFSLAFKLFGGDDRAAMLPHRPLRQLRLVEIVQTTEQGLSTGSLRADEHVVAFADGELTRDSGPRLEAMLAMYLRPVPPAEPGSLAGSHRKVADALAREWKPSNRRNSSGWLTCFSGVDVRGKLEVAAAAASGRSMFVLSARQLPTHLPDVDLFSLLWKRDSLLYPLALFIDYESNDSAAPDATGHRRYALERLLAQVRGSGPVVLATRDPWAGGEPVTNFAIEKPRRVEQEALWTELLRPALSASGGSETASVLAWQFNLDAQSIREIADDEIADAADACSANAGEDASPAVKRRLWSACRTAARPALEGLATRVDSRARLADIVLPPQQKELLRKIAAQVNVRSRVYNQWGFAGRSSRGLGIAVLFAGESGTGKTMAAEVLAAELNLDLYRIDLSAVVSKYIGETERNLRRLFDAAEDGGAILFFDEADALFGKRSEVKDSHDRYSNIQVNYLLQRMESYRGLAILATNMKSSLDHAFLRRLRFTVDFAAPSHADRRTIWSKAFPEVMLDDLGRPEVNYDRLARLKLVGGNIHSIALNAAFLAADRRCPLTTGLVLEVARDEFVKLGRHIVEEDFALAPGAPWPSASAIPSTGAA
jgi:hypothetical protein